VSENLHVHVCICTCVLVAKKAVAEQGSSALLKPRPGESAFSPLVVSLVTLASGKEERAHCKRQPHRPLWQLIFSEQ
jgi:hypothetical protein